jgi:hypothetical protein
VSLLLRPFGRAYLDNLCTIVPPRMLFIFHADSAFRANSALAGRRESITLRDRGRRSGARPPTAFADGGLHTYGRLGYLRDPDSRAGRRMPGVGGPLADVRGPHAVRDQRFDRLADQLAAGSRTFPRHAERSRRPLSRAP